MFHEVSVLVVDWVCLLAGVASHFIRISIQPNHSHIHLVRWQNFQLLVWRHDCVWHFSVDRECGAAQNGDLVHWLLGSHDSVTSGNILGHPFHRNSVLGLPHFVLHLV